MKHVCVMGLQIWLMVSLSAILHLSIKLFDCSLSVCVSNNILSVMSVARFRVLTGY